MKNKEDKQTMEQLQFWTYGPKRRDKQTAPYHNMVSFMESRVTNWFIKLQHIMVLTFLGHFLMCGLLCSL